MEDTADLGRQRLKGSWPLTLWDYIKIIHPDKTIGHFVGGVDDPSGFGFQAPIPFGFYRFHG